MKLRYSAPWIRRGLFYLLIVSPLLRGSNPYPNGSLTYRDDLFYLYTKPGAQVCQTFFGENSTNLCGSWLQFTPYFCNNHKRLEDSVFSPDKRNHGRWSARVSDCAKTLAHSDYAFNGFTACNARLPAPVNMGVYLLSFQPTHPRVAYCFLNHKYQTYYCLQPIGIAGLFA